MKLFLVKAFYLKFVEKVKCILNIDSAGVASYLRTFFGQSPATHSSNDFKHFSRSRKLFAALRQEMKSA